MYMKGHFDAKAAVLEKMQPEGVTWHSDQRPDEDAATIVKEFFATRYRRTGEAHVCKCVSVGDFAPCLNELAPVCSALD